MIVIPTITSFWYAVQIARLLDFYRTLQEKLNLLTKC